MSNRKRLVSSAFSITLALIATISSTAIGAGNKATPVKAKICLVLPKAHLGQGDTGTDIAEPVRTSLTSYLSGPATEIVPLSARVPIQIDAEAEQSNCEYVLYTSVVQKKSANLGKYFAMAAPAANALPSVAGATGGY